MDERMCRYVLVCLCVCVLNAMSTMIKGSKKEVR